MQLDRLELADIHDPVVLANRIHDGIGLLSSAVPIIDVARALDIMEVRLERLEGVEGMLLTNQVRSTGSILANTSKGDRRARFTIAHELGHFLMERHQLTDAAGFRCTTNDMRETREGRQVLRQEAQANQFAIELLAPASMMVPFFAKEPDLRDVKALRDRLEVSLEAGARRMITLRDEPLAAVWSNQGKVRYLVKNHRFPFVALKHNDPIPKSSAAHQVISQGKTGITQFCETHSLASTDREDLVLYEQSRVAVNGYAVTLLWAEAPDEDDEDDGGLAELGTPGFR